MRSSTCWRAGSARRYGAPGSVSTMRPKASSRISARRRTTAARPRSATAAGEAASPTRATILLPTAASLPGASSSRPAPGKISSASPGEEATANAAALASSLSSHEPNQRSRQRRAAAMKSWIGPRAMTRTEAMAAYDWLGAALPCGHLGPALSLAAMPPPVVALWSRSLVVEACRLHNIVARPLQGSRDDGSTAVASQACGPLGPSVREWRRRCGGPGYGAPGRRRPRIAAAALWKSAAARVAGRAFFSIIKLARTPERLRRILGGDADVTGGHAGYLVCESGPAKVRRSAPHRRFPIRGRWSSRPSS